MKSKPSEPLLGQRTFPYYHPAGSAGPRPKLQREHAHLLGSCFHIAGGVSNGCLLAFSLCPLMLLFPGTVSPSAFLWPVVSSRSSLFPLSPPAPAFFLSHCGVDCTDTTLTFFSHLPIPQSKAAGISLWDI